jgi:hypothetical protein
MAAAVQGNLIMVQVLAMVVFGIIYFVVFVLGSDNRTNNSSTIGGSLNKIMKAGKKFIKNK